MLVMRAAAAGCALACAAASPAPVYLPTRDVSVDYRLVADGPHPDIVTMDYSAGEGRARIDGGAGLLYAIVDRRAGRLTIIVDVLRAYVAQPFDAGGGYALHISREATFTPLGSGRVAGLPCRKWSVRASEGEATACLTPDGVILRAVFRSPRGRGSLEAVRVDYGRQPAARFAVPDGYTAVDPAALPPSMRHLLPAG